MIETMQMDLLMQGKIKLFFRLLLHLDIWGDLCSFGPLNYYLGVNLSQAGQVKNMLDNVCLTRSQRVIQYLFI